MSKKNTRILIVDDEEIVRESLLGLAREGRLHDRDGAGRRRRRSRPMDEEPLVDPPRRPEDAGHRRPRRCSRRVKEKQPETAVVIMTAYATVDTAVNAMKIGAYDYIVKPFDPEELSLMVQKIVAQQALVRENVILRKVLKREYRFHDLVSKSPAMQATSRARADRRAQPLDDPHPRRERHRARSSSPARSTPRARAHDKPFVAVSCAALTETLLESELFGYEKGAFTGAAGRREGKFEAAHGGTLFLDEIGDISPKLQLDLLRVLEERQRHARRRHGVRSRWTCASSRRRTGTSQKAVADGRVPRRTSSTGSTSSRSRSPPLRERQEDIPLLVDHFLEQLAVEMKQRGRGRLAPRRWRSSWPTRGRATCASCATSSSAAIVVARGPLLQAGRPRPHAARRGDPGAPRLARGDRAAAHRRGPPEHGRQRHAGRAHPRHRPRHALQQDPQARA